MDLTGTKIGPLRIDELLAEGGMGQVYRGTDRRLDRPVAIKSLHAGKRDDPVGRARFVREARILSRLDHPSICRIFGLLQHQGDDLLVLELLDGETLDRVAPDLTYEEKLDMAIELADALNVAHRQQVIHRDLKPQNVMVTPDGTPKILDFGIARPSDPPAVEDEADEQDSRLWDATDLELEATLAGGGRHVEVQQPDSVFEPPFVTHGNKTVGTVAYMSPEQASRQTLTVASDMYTFGVLLHELFTGRRAYPESESFLHLLSRVGAARTEPVEGLETPLKELIEELESLDPGRRPSALETRDRLRAIREAPERRRRALAIRAAVVAVVLSLAVAVGAVIHGRLEAERREDLAREMTGEAAEIEWLMRAEHLAPPHDLRPARERVRRRMAELERRGDELGPRGRAAAHVALGRSALALGEVESAADFLGRAWQAGLRDPAVASVYGEALARSYGRARIEADRKTHEMERRRILQEAETRWLIPARQALASAISGGDASGRHDLIEPMARARLAALSASWEVALAEAVKAAERRSWVYEADLFAAGIHHQRMLRRWQDRGDLDGALEDLEQARQRLEIAGRVGRSDPEVHLTACSLAYDELVIYLSRTGDRSVDDAYLDGLGACRKALELDPELAEAHLLLALLHSRRAETADGDEFTDLLDRSTAAAERALELDPKQPDAYRSLAMGHQIRADREGSRGGDPTPWIVASLAACRQGLEIDPRHLSLLNLVGNAQLTRADSLAARGIDPMPAILEGRRVYLRAIGIAEELGDGESDPFVRANLAILYETEVAWLLRHDRDPTASIEAGLRQVEVHLAELPESLHARRSRAALRTFRAQWMLDRGRQLEPDLEPDFEQDFEPDFQAEIEAAIADADHAASLAESPYSELERLRSRCVAVAGSLRFDRDPGPRAAEALVIGESLERDDPSLLGAWTLRSGLHSDLAAWELEAGDAEAALRQSRAAVQTARRALDVDPLHVDAVIRFGEAALVLHRALEHTGTPDKGTLDHTEVLDRAATTLRGLAEREATGEIVARPETAALSEQISEQTGDGQTGAEQTGPEVEARSVR